MDRTLDKPTKVLIGGIVTSALVYGAGELNTHRLEQKVQRLQQACIAEQNAAEKKQDALSALARIFTFKPSCDPAELARSAGYTAVQEQLGTTERELLHWDSWCLIAATGIAVMSCLPWLWYFFLRRIRELREAIGGR